MINKHLHKDLDSFQGLFLFERKDESLKFMIFIGRTYGTF